MVTHPKPFDQGRADAFPSDAITAGSLRGSQSGGTGAVTSSHRPVVGTKTSSIKTRERADVKRELLTLNAAANYIHAPVGKLVPYLRLRGKRKLPARKVRGRWEIDLAIFQDWLLNLYEEQISKSQSANRR
jgi:hypothetical protein